MVGTLVRRPLPPVSDFIRTLLDDATAAAALTTLGVGSSFFTPTLTSLANLDATTAFSSWYDYVGQTVRVWGLFQADTTAASSTATRLGMSLPIASDFSSAVDLAGTGARVTTNVLVNISADITNNRADLNWLADVTTNTTYVFHFSYRVI